MNRLRPLLTAHPSLLKGNQGGKALKSPISKSWLKRIAEKSKPTARAEIENGKLEFGKEHCDYDRVEYVQKNIGRK